MPHFPRVHEKYPRLFLKTLVVWLILAATHFALWAYTVAHTQKTWTELLQSWDAGWYLRIAMQGYDTASYAFLPLFPYAIRGLGKLFQVEGAAPHIALGIILTSLCMAMSLYFFCHRAVHQSSEPSPSKWGLLLFICSPAAYVFHTLHTESLFLLASVLAFRALRREQVLAAASWAGAAALVRHQGVFLAMAIAFAWAAQAVRPADQGRRFVSVGLISGLIWSLTPAFHLWHGREAIPALSAHSEHWYMADGLSSYFNTFFLANPIQNVRIGSLVHHGFYLLLLGGTVLLLRRRRWAEGIYCFLSLAVLPLQGELVDSFRFGAVLFPLFFLGGEWLAKLKIWLRWPLFAGYGLFNLLVAWLYGNNRWAY